MQQRRQHRPSGRSIVFLVFVAGTSFYAGYLSSSSTALPLGKNDVAFDNDSNGRPVEKLEDCHDYQQRMKKISAEVNRRVADSTITIRNSSQNRKHNENNNKNPSFIQAMARISKHELMSAFDNFGVATLESPPTDEALLIYNHADAIPDKLLQSSPAVNEYEFITRIDNVTEAIQNCGSLNVQCTHTPVGFRPQCHVWIPAHNLPAFHVDRWMRLSDATTNSNKFNHNAPLQHVGSITTPNGVDRFDLPAFKTLISAHWKALLQFFENSDVVLEDIRKILKSNGIKPPTAKHIKNDTLAHEAITVMTVNYGQSDLLVNFFCAAKARGLDLHRVLVFVTDEETKQLVEGFSKDLGVMVYYDERNFAALPKGGEHVKYGDGTFTSMMFAKILCVLYVNLSGYDTLYQDVDIVYYRNPLDFFNDYGSGSQNYDMIFQHDGSTQPRYAPYSCNSGFFYTRSNKKVQYLLTSLLYHGDLIRKTRSHQQVLNQLLLEHSSLFGLKVKVLDRHDYLHFPGGYHFNFDDSTMHQIISGELKPYIFHMFFTDGKETKVKFLKQFGEWYVHEECTEKLVDSANNLPVSHCCSEKPLISCYYKDKPSTIPCNDSPAHDENGEPFWKQ